MEIFEQRKLAQDFCFWRTQRVIAMTAGKKNKWHRLFPKQRFTDDAEFSRLSREVSQFNMLVLLFQVLWVTASLAIGVQSPGNLQNGLVTAAVVPAISSRWVCGDEWRRWLAGFLSLLMLTNIVQLIVEDEFRNLPLEVVALLVYLIAPLSVWVRCLCGQRQEKLTQLQLLFAESFNGQVVENPSGGLKAYKL